MKSSPSFFIAGAQRSGTTLLGKMLDRHSAISIDNRTIIFRLISCFFLNHKIVLPHNLEHSYHDLQSWLIKSDYKGRLASFLDHEHLDSYTNMQELVEQAIEKRLSDQQKTVFVDKAPNVEFFISDLLTLIPDAKFIHMVRDGRAVALSHKKRTNKNLYLSGDDWVLGLLEGLQMRQILGEDRYHFIRYEDLLNKPQETLASLCSFMHIPFEESMIVSAESKNEKELYAKSILDTSKADLFKKDLTDKQIRKLEYIQAPMLRRFDYQIMNQDALIKHKRLSYLKRAVFNQMDGLIKLFVGKREGMVDGKIVQLSIPFTVRCKEFIFQLGRDLLPEIAFKRLFRKRWIKELYLKK